MPSIGLLLFAGSNMARFKSGLQKKDADKSIEELLEELKNVRSNASKSKEIR